jgi:phosphoribosylaminoimidazole-succinocarboxamide synthase
METKNMLHETYLPDLGTPKKGKVRDVYDLGDRLLIVVTDRLSAFDVVMPDAIPDKGKVLNQIALFWFEHTTDIVRNHILEWDTDRYPENLKKHADQLKGRSVIVTKTKTFPVECVVRGYLSGSGWEEYRKNGSVCGIILPPNLKESDRLEEPIFTPTTKADEGHDMPISMEQVVELIGKTAAEELKRLSIALYTKGAKMAEAKGIIIADTKFEFGSIDDQVILIDEILTPDSSRFWSMANYQSGKGQDSFDKQIVRDYLNTLDWNKTYPGPQLPHDIIEKTASRYREIYRILSGRELS